MIDANAAAAAQHAVASGANNAQALAASNAAAAAAGQRIAQADAASANLMASLGVPLPATQPVAAPSHASGPPPPAPSPGAAQQQPVPLSAMTPTAQTLVFNAVLATGVIPDFIHEADRPLLQFMLVSSRTTAHAVAQHRAHSAHGVSV
jgi:hypothetical protein